MATYTDNYQLTKPTYAEQADIGVINSNMNKIDEVMHSSQISLAPAYDQSQTYAKGDVVMYELLMYKCISPTTGVWDGSKWERTTASESGGGGSAELDILGEASGAVASFADGASAELAKCIVEIVPKQAGSGTPSPDNVRAISGYTAVKVDVAGKNLVFQNTIEDNKFLDGTGRAIENIDCYVTGFIPLVNGRSIHIPSTGSARRCTYYSNKEFKEYLNDSNEQILTPDFDGYLRVTARYDTVAKADMMINYGDSAGEFEPHNGSTTTSPLGQTVYGGRLNVLTGELTIDRYMVVLDGVNNTVTVSAATNPNGRAVIYGAQVNTVDVYRAKSLCDKLSWSESGHAGLSLSEYTATVASGGASMTVRFVLPISASATTAEANTYLQSNSYAFVFPLATPQTVQLTPQEVNSLLGQNNISANTGDIDIVYVKASAPIQPNPTGTPTATLKKLGIEGTVFEVPSGGGGSSSGINYSTTEQKTGQKWIDGKPLYQKVITTANVSGNGNIDITSLSAETAFIVGGYVHLTGNANISLNEYIEADYYTYCHVNGNKIDYKLSGYTGSYIIIIQYTKITD